MIRSVFIGSDQSVGVFDWENKRVAELCGSYETVHEKLFETLKGQKVAPAFYDERIAKQIGASMKPVQ